MSSSIGYIDDQNGNHVFPVTHERAVRDSDGVTLETKLGQKQDTIQDLSTIRSGAAAGAAAVQPAALDAKQDVISDLQTIRSGAAAGATAYQKPASGIPASDIASGVIPTVPTISTDVSADAASDVKTSSPKSVKTYVDVGIAAVESDLSDLADEVEAIDIGAYVMAWDGNSEPVVANIPAGVSVTYNSTTYTGTLAASASTIQKIYLVATGTTGNYDRYITVGDSTYSWVNIGTTEITLADYATKTDVSQLGQEVEEMSALYKKEEPIVLLSELAGYLAFGKFYSGGTTYVVRVYSLQAGYSYTLSANITLSRPTLDYATLFQAMPENNASGEVLVSPIEIGSISETINPQTDCYLAIMAKSGTADIASPLSLNEAHYIDFNEQTEQLSSDVVEINENLDDVDARVTTLEGELPGKDVYKDISNKNERYYANSWVSTSLGKLMSANDRSVRAYYVNKGDKIKATGMLTNSPEYGFVSFYPGELPPVVNDLVTILKAYGDTDKNIVSFDYTAQEDGWILICFRSSTVENRYSGYDWNVYEYQSVKDGSSLIYPGEINAVVDDTLQLFYRGMSKVINTHSFDFFAKCRYGIMYPRYFEYTPTAGNVGKQLLTLQLRNIDGQVLSGVQLQINVVGVPVSPSSEKRILILGDSLTQAGVWPHELDRRLTSTDIATPTMPAGKGLSNIRFIGGMENSGTRYFGVGGLGWSSYANEGNPAFRFQVTGVTSIVKGAVYSNNGFQYTVIENNTTGGVGNILCSTSAATNVPSASGTLTKVSGNGDAGITFTSSAADQQNPLWDGDGISFANYVSELGESGLDCVIFFVGWNDLRPEQDDFTGIQTYIENILTALHDEYPQAKAVLMGLQLPSLNGGLGANYGASGGYSDLYGIIRAVYNYNAFLRELSESADYSSFVHYVDVASEFDSENNMPQSPAQVNTRNADTERRGTNGVHPATAGQMQIADVVYRWFVANFCR